MELSAIEIKFRDLCELLMVMPDDDLDSDEAWGIRDKLDDLLNRMGPGQMQRAERAAIDNHKTRTENGQIDT